MRHKHGIHSCRQGRVDVRLRTVAYHPARVGRQIVFGRDFPVGGNILFRDDLNGREILFQSGALDFSRLLRNRALGHQNQVMTLGEIGQRLRDSGNDLDGVLGNGMSESVDGRVERRGERLNRQALEGVDQSMSKTVQSIPVLKDALTLHLVQNFPHLFR